VKRACAPARPALRALAALALGALVLPGGALASGASATLTATAPASGSWVFTITDSGASPITGFYVRPGAQAPISALDPAGPCVANAPLLHDIACAVTVQPGAYASFCYTGAALAELLPGASVRVEGAEAGFIPVRIYPSASTPCPTGRLRSAGPAPPRCVVPDVRGKQLAEAERAIRRSLCAVGRITTRRAARRSGRVLSTSPAAYRQLGAHGRVDLVVGAR
jgi:hypothetical protein